MSHRTIYVLGTNHLSKKSAEYAENAITKIRPKIILSEGVNIPEALEKKDIWLRNPVLSIGLWIWMQILSLGSEEFIAAEKMAKQENIRFHNIDMTPVELIDELSVWWNVYSIPSSVVVGMSGYFFASRISVYLGACVAFIIFCTIYFLIFALRTRTIRDKQFASKIKQTLDQHPKTKVLFICGKLHIGPLKERFTVVEI